jgi:hypothetical protein
MHSATPTQRTAYGTLPRNAIPGLILALSWEYTEIALYQKDGLQALDTYCLVLYSTRAFFATSLEVCPAGNWQGAG